MVWETRATWKNDPADTRQCSCLNVLHSHSCAFEMLKDACFVLYTQAFISEMLLRQQPKKKKKSLWKVEAINIISFEEPVSASLRECPMTVSEASGGEESVLKSSVEITTRKSCWSKHSEVWGCGGGGVNALLREEDSKRSALAVLRGLHPHWAWRKCTRCRLGTHTHIVGIHHNTCRSLARVVAHL